MQGRIVGLVLFAAGSARAEPGPVGLLRQLEWRVPAELGCGSEADFAREVEEHLGRTVFDSAGTTSVRVQVVRREQWSLHLQLLDLAGNATAEREWVFAAENCGAALHSASLALELLLEGDIETAQPETATALSDTEAETQPPPSKSKPEVPPVLPPEPRRPSPWELSLGGAGYAGTLPSLAVGFGGGLGYGFDSGFALRLDAGVTTPSSNTEVVDGVPVELSLVLERVSLGAFFDVVHDERQRHGFGLVGHVGQLELDVQGARPLGGGAVPWAALGARARSRILLRDPVVLVAMAEVLTPLLEDEFTEAEGTVLASLPPLGGALFFEIGSAW